jgi:hypothetical protein
VTKLLGGRPGFDFRQGKILLFLFATASRQALGPTQPPEIQRPVLEADESYDSAEVKNAWSYTSIPLYGVVLNEA